MGEREKNRIAVERLALRRLESYRKAGVSTNYEREYREAAKVARETDASDADRRRAQQPNVIAKKKREEARLERLERERDTSARKGESKQAWLERMRREHGVRRDDANPFPFIRVGDDE